MDWGKVATTVKVIVALLALAWGGLAPLVQLLVGLMVLDIITGLLAAFATQTLSSDVSYRGMAKKAIVLCLVGAASLVEPRTGLPLSAAVAGFYCASELLSIVENAARAGLPVPQILRDALAKLSPTAPVAKDAANG